MYQAFGVQFPGSHNSASQVLPTKKVHVKQHDTCQTLASHRTPGDTSHCKTHHIQTNFVPFKIVPPHFEHQFRVVRIESNSKCLSTH